MLANESQAVPWVLQWNHVKMESDREGVVIIVRFGHGSARLDIEDPTNRYLGWVSYVSGACHTLPRVTTNTRCVARCRGTW